ncbi:MAG TPA: ABC transporter ATP-binding protein [Chloroflexia bacterium]|nr:ABC transporter ATP-binding protein [Chloroflexia bacterium]
MSSEQPILEVTDLVKSYPAEEGSFLSSLLGGSGQRVPALNGVSFTLKEGEVLGLIGESGSGKSALARIVAGQEKPDKGKVIFMGKNISVMAESELKPLRQRNLRYLPENAFEGLTADPKNRVDRLLYDLADKFPPADGRGGRSAANEILNRVGLGEQYLNRFPNQMSGGEKQRLAIARALMLRPKLIVADEPVSNLDLNTRTEVLNLMKRLAREYRIAFVFISHNPSMVRYFTGTGRIAIMFAGRIMEIVPGHEFFNRATHPYTKSLLSVNYAPSPLPGGALDPTLAISEHERVDSNTMELETLETELSAEGNIAASAQLAAANRAGCPFYRWCPEHFERCTQVTPQLLTVTHRREGDQSVPIAESEVEAAHRAACLWYIDQ